ncbi:hypothetical protein PLESTM_002002200 [Pleodorina starrii]|nr:hypothetical protein PLESTM_002002200 [Pleodorina starrii]
MLAVLHVHAMERRQSMRVIAAVILGFLYSSVIRSFAATVGNDSEHPAVLLKTCWNEAFDPAPRGFKDWLAGRPTSLNLAGVWWSNRTSSVPLTVFTMVSRDRLPMLEMQCRSYVGPLVAAIHVPVLVRRVYRRNVTGDGGGDSNGNGQRRRLQQQREQLQQQEPGFSEPLWVHETHESELGKTEQGRSPQINAFWAELQALFERMESGSGCQLRLLLFTERVWDRPLAAIMPTNAMRNAAMAAVTTPLAAMIDVDLGPSNTLNQLITNATWVQLILAHSITPTPKLFILPAWEPNPSLDMHTASRVAEEASRADKASLVELCRNKTIDVFQASHCPPCHGPTDHSRWATDDQAYGVPYRTWFEPWGIMWRFHDPGYDERFRGWYFDKVSYAETLGRLWQFQFIILPSCWLVHRPHAKVAIAQLRAGIVNSSSASASDPNIQALLQSTTFGRNGNATMYEHYLTYVVSQQVALRSLISQGAGYVPQLNPQLQHCRRVLPWWKTS